MNSPYAVETANTRTRFTLKDDWKHRDGYEILVARDAALLFTNFAGEPDGFNPRGARKFNLVLNPDIAEALRERGWNVRTYVKEGYDSYMSITVNVNMDSSRPPVIHLISSDGGQIVERKIGVDEVADLDDYRYSRIDVEVVPYEHGRNVSSGTRFSAYLSKMRLILAEDDDNSFFENCDDGEELPFN